MARDISRLFTPQQNPLNPEYDYVESDFLPPEVASFLRQGRRRPLLVKGVVMGAILGLAATFIAMQLQKKSRRRNPESFPETLAM